MCQAVVPTECGFTSAIINRVYVVVRCKNTACSEIRNPGRALASSAVAFGEERGKGAWYLAPAPTAASASQSVVVRIASATLGAVPFWDSEPGF